jgi:hypothetical protein
MHAHSLRHRLILTIFVHNTEVDVKLIIKVLKNIQDALKSEENIHRVGIRKRIYLTSYEVKNIIISITNAHICIHPCYYCVYHYCENQRKNSSVKEEESKGF